MFKRILFLVLVLLALVAMPVAAQGPTVHRVARSETGQSGDPNTNGANYRRVD